MFFDQIWTRMIILPYVFVSLLMKYLGMSLGYEDFYYVINMYYIEMK